MVVALAEAELQALVSNPSVEVRVGKQFIRSCKEADLEELLVQWDTNGDGQVDHEEAVAGMRACGVEGTDEELMALSMSFDADASGTLEIDEVRAGLERLMEARRAGERTYQELKSRLATAVGVSASKQNELETLLQAGADINKAEKKQQQGAAVAEKNSEKNKSPKTRR